MLTKEDLEQIATVFGISPLSNILPVSDGTVSLEMKVWWHSEDGPELVSVKDHFSNIKEFPDIYSLQQPNFKVTYY